MSKKHQIGYSLIVWETLKEYNEETKWYEPTKNKRVEVAQLLSEELSDNEDVKSMLLDKLFGYKDYIKEMLKNNEFTEIPDYHKESLEKDQKISDLEAKLVESEENNKLLEMQLQDMERSKLSWENQYFTLYNTLKNYREVTEKKHLLDETEWQDYCAYKHIEPQIKGCLDREKELKQQLAEKESELAIFKKRDIDNQKQLERQMNIHKHYLIKKDQDKISFAVEQLEKVRHILLGYYSSTNYKCIKEVCRDIDKQINNQIKQLKEMK